MIFYLLVNGDPIRQAVTYGHEKPHKKAFAELPSAHGFVVKRFFNLKTWPKKQRGEFKKNKIVLIRMY